MSVPSQRIDAVVRDHVAPALKRHGFKKFDRSWYLDSPDVVQAINLQGSSWNDDESARFTLNLGLWFPAVSELMGRPPEKNRRPPDYRCTVRQRIGKLTADGADLWWTLATDSASETVGPEVVDALVQVWTAVALEAGGTS